MYFKNSVMLIPFFLFAVETYLTEDQFKCINNEFYCFHFLKMFPKTDNVFFSPTGIFLGMDFLYTGSGGNTANEMSSTLKYSKIGSNENINIVQNVWPIDWIEGGEGNYKYFIKNYFVYRRDCTVVPRFKEWIKIYSTIVKEIITDPSIENTITTINKQISQEIRLNPQISQREIPLNPQMFFLDFVYFNLMWKSSFDPRSSFVSIFYNYGINPTYIRMMNTINTFKVAYFPDRGFKAIELPYKGEQHSMLIILPTCNRKLYEIEDDLNENILNEIISELRPQKINLYIPKFRIEECRSLKNHLILLKLGNMFAESANFSGIFNKDKLYLNDFRYKSFIDVNERGNETPTGQNFCINAVPDFTINYPFLFLIRNLQSNVILFAGRKVNF